MFSLPLQTSAGRLLFVLSESETPWEDAEESGLGRWPLFAFRPFSLAQKLHQVAQPPPGSVLGENPHLPAPRPGQARGRGPPTGPSHKSRPMCSPCLVAGPSVGAPVLNVKCGRLA